MKIVAATGSDCVKKRKLAAPGFLGKLSKGLLGTRDRHLLRRELHALGRCCIARDPAVQRFGDLLSIAITAKLLLLGGTAHKRNFREDTRHGALAENHESGFFDSAITQARILH